MGVGQIVDVPDQDRQLDPVPATPAQDCLRALPKLRGGWRRLPARVEDRGTVMLLAGARAGASARAITAVALARKLLRNATWRLDKGVEYTRVRQLTIFTTNKALRH